MLGAQLEEKSSDRNPLACPCPMLAGGPDGPEFPGTGSEKQTCSPNPDGPTWKSTENIAVKFHTVPVSDSGKLNHKPSQN